MGDTAREVAEKLAPVLEGTPRGDAYVELLIQILEGYATEQIKQLRDEYDAAIREAAVLHKSNQQEIAWLRKVVSGDYKQDITVFFKEKHEQDFNF